MGVPRGKLPSDWLTLKSSSPEALTQLREPGLVPAAGAEGQLVSLASKIFQ